MYTLYGALPEPYVPVRVTLGAVIAHQYTYKQINQFYFANEGIETGRGMSYKNTNYMS